MATGPGAGDADELARWLAGATVAVAVAETVLLRLATRTAIHIPGIEQVATPYGVFASIGRFAFYAASVLATLTLVLLARLLVRQGRRYEAAAAGLVVVAALGARLDLVTNLALGLAVGAVVTGLAVVVVRSGARPRPAVALYGLAFAVTTVHATSQDLSGSGALRPGNTVPLLVAAEVAVLIALLALPRVVPAMGRRDVVLGIVVGVVVLGAFTANTATSTILLLWTFGLAGYFPTVVYAAAAGVLAAALAALARQQPDLAVSLGLVVLGGIGLHSSYQSTLAVCGLALLVAGLGDRHAIAPVEQAAPAEAAATTAM